MVAKIKVPTLNKSIVILGIEEYDGSQVTRAVLYLGCQQTIYIRNGRNCMCGKVALYVKRKIRLKYGNTQSKINTEKEHKIYLQKNPVPKQHSITVRLYHQHTGTLRYKILGKNIFAGVSNDYYIYYISLTKSNNICLFVIRLFSPHRIPGSFLERLSKKSLWCFIVTKGSCTDGLKKRATEDQLYHLVCWIQVQENKQ